MTLDEAFILTCHTGYISDHTFVTEDKLISQDFLDRVANLLQRDVYMEEFVVDQEKIGAELKQASYTKWMEILNSEKH